THSISHIIISDHLRQFNYTSQFYIYKDTSPTKIYTLSLHDALPICQGRGKGRGDLRLRFPLLRPDRDRRPRRGKLYGLRAFRDEDRKSTRLNSSHLVISYAVFCLKKKK